MNAASWLQSKRLVEIKDDIKQFIRLAKKENNILSKVFLKKSVKTYFDKGGKASLRDLSKILNGSEIPVAIGWLKKNGWADISKEKIPI